MSPDFTIFYRDTRTLYQDGKSIGLIHHQQIIRLSGKKLTNFVFEDAPDFDEDKFSETDPFFAEENHAWSNLKTYDLSEEQVAEVGSLLEDLRGLRGDFRSIPGITMGSGDQGFYSKAFDFLFLGHVRAPIHHLWSKVSQAAGGPGDFDPLEPPLLNTALPDDFCNPWDELKSDVNPLVQRMEPEQHYIGRPYLWPRLERLLESQLERGADEALLLKTAKAAILHRDKIPAEGLLDKGVIWVEFDPNFELAETTLYVWEELEDLSISPESDLERWGVLSRARRWLSKNAPAVLNSAEWKELVDGALSRYQIFGYPTHLILIKGDQ